MPTQNDVTLHEGQFLRFKRRGDWEFVERTNASQVAVIIALTTTRELVLVEQYRPPVTQNVIELPAGLVGDSGDEELIAAAQRELMEETGYLAPTWQRLMRGPVSPGITNEIVDLLIASDATRAGPGGGVGSEAIIVHTVPLSTVPQWLNTKRNQGVWVDPKVYAGVFLASQPQ